MKNRSFKYISLLVVLILLIVLRLFTNNNTSKSSQQNKRYPESTNNHGAAPVPDNEPSGDLNRNTTHLIYSRHARCRMDCRHISEDEIKEVLAHGIVNQRKIEIDNRGETYPLEETVSGHRLRVVFAPKGQDAIEVVTCIDLDTEWQCDCH